MQVAPSTPKPSPGTASTTQLSALRGPRPVGVLAAQPAANGNRRLLRLTHPPPSGPADSASWSDVHFWPPSPSHRCQPHVLPRVTTEETPSLCPRRGPPGQAPRGSSTLPPPPPRASPAALRTRGQHSHCLGLPLEGCPVSASISYQPLTQLLFLKGGAPPSFQEQPPRFSPWAHVLGRLHTHGHCACWSTGLLSCGVSAKRTPDRCVRHSPWRTARVQAAPG